MDTRAPGCTPLGAASRDIRGHACTMSHRASCGEREACRCGRTPACHAPWGWLHRQLGLISSCGQAQSVRTTGVQLGWEAAGRPPRQPLPRLLLARGRAEAHTPGACLLLRCSRRPQSAWCIPAPGSGAARRTRGGTCGDMWGWKAHVDNLQQYQQQRLADASSSSSSAITPPLSLLTTGMPAAVMPSSSEAMVSGGTPLFSARASTWSQWRVGWACGVRSRRCAR